MNGLEWNEQRNQELDDARAKGIDVETVYAGWRGDQKVTSPPPSFMDTLREVWGPTPRVDWRDDPSAVERAEATSTEDGEN